MTPFQVELWALEVLERVLQGRPLEDSRVEIKKAFIDPNKAARRIGGHANAARGDPVLWIVGVDDKGAIVGTAATDFATWWPNVAKEFDGSAPALVEVVATLSGHPPVVAIQFDTSRYPFVVKNPVGGTPGGGPVSLEIPWRTAT